LYTTKRASKDSIRKEIPEKQCWEIVDSLHAFPRFWPFSDTDAGDKFGYKEYSRQLLSDTKQRCVGHKLSPSTFGHNLDPSIAYQERKIITKRLKQAEDNAESMGHRLSTMRKYQHMVMHE